MWILEKNPKKAAQYKDELLRLTGVKFDPKTHLKMNLKNADLKETKAYKFITEDKFLEYLTAEPKRLLELHNELFLHLYGDDFNQVHYTEYLKDIKDGKPEIRHKEYDAIDQQEIEALNSIFNYSAWISGKPEFSYFVSSLLGVNTCTYCNRQYTLTIMEKDGTRIIRPEFDHWFAQSLYPDLAVSFYNLIPSCSFCNSILKNAKETEYETHVHPYLDDDPGFKFSYSPCVNGYSVETLITAGSEKDKQRVLNTLKLFKIKEVYNAHADLELKDLIELAYSNPTDYIDTIINNAIKDANLSREAAFRLIFGIETMPGKYINRPLSKFKTDILMKLHENIVDKK